jgi:cardiolipin synthase
VSAYASSEVNLDIRNRPFATMVQARLDEIILKDCIKISGKKFISSTGFFKRFLQRASYEIIRIVLNLFTFYFKHE